ncbi:hypothetical protein ACWGH8_29320 [Nonomuraea muscovyensis]
MADESLGGGQLHAGVEQFADERAPEVVRCDAPAKDGRVESDPRPRGPPRPSPASRTGEVIVTT